MMTSVFKEKRRGRRVGPSKDPPRRSVSDTTINRGDEGSAQEDDGHPADEDAAEAEGKTAEDLHEDACYRNPTETIAKVRESGSFRCEYELAGIATTLAVEPRSGGGCALSLSPRARHCRKYPDRYVHNRRRLQSL